MRDVLTKEFYDAIENTVNNINIQWILLKNKINTNDFKNILDQIYSISIEPNIVQFSYRLSKFKMLYRAVKSSPEYPNYAKAEDMIPKFGNKTKISMCKFKVVSKYSDCRIIDISLINQSYDSILNEARKELRKYKSIILKKSQKKLKSGSVNYAGLYDYIKKMCMSNKTDKYLTKVSSIYLAKGVLKIFLDNILIPLDDDNDDRQKEYRPFHAMAEYFESKNLGGILYQSTRMKKINLIGSNIVLFNKNSALPEKSSIKYFIY